ncbi:hypothetical protein B9T62_15315 [Paenibacillus donghaensis]|uniref:Uncharacterized protein n=1 Tax=Paenibacillus donghaensis TaxID=414771 RepID=A0A2Z2KLQ7_9BACL|nr:hypothetical protein B9T62_15315 [Paenibacillus donghaensis]
MNVKTVTILLIAFTGTNIYLLVLAILTGDLRRTLFCGLMLIIFFFEFKYLRPINEELKSIYTELKDKYKK